MDRNTNSNADDEAPLDVDISNEQGLQAVRERLAALEQRKAHVDATLKQIGGLAAGDESLRDITELLKHVHTRTAAAAADTVNRSGAERQAVVQEKRANSRQIDELKVEEVGEDEDGSTMEEQRMELDAAKRRLDRLTQLNERFQQLRSRPDANAVEQKAPSVQPTPARAEQTDSLAELVEERDRLLALQRRLAELRNMMPEEVSSALDDLPSGSEITRAKASSDSKPVQQSTQSASANQHKSNFSGNPDGGMIRIPSAFEEKTLTDVQLLPGNLHSEAAVRSGVDIASLTDFGSRLANTTALCETLERGQQRLHEIVMKLPRSTALQVAPASQAVALSADTQLSLNVSQCQQNLLHQHAEIQQLKQAVSMLLDKQGIQFGAGFHSLNNAQTEDRSVRTLVESDSSSAASPVNFTGSVADKPTTPSTLRDSVCDEAATLISLNARSPQYLVELFSTLRFLRSDEQRAGLLNSIREKVSRNQNRNNQSPQSTDGAVNANSDVIARFVYELDRKLAEMLGRLTKITTVEAISAQLRTYVIDKLEASGFCSLIPSNYGAEKMTYRKRFVIGKIDRALTDSIGKYSDKRVCDCFDALLADIADVLHTELNWLKATSSLNTC